MICNNCGRSFDTPATAHQMHYEVDTMREEAYQICPYCNSEEIEESSVCPVCGNEKALTDDYCDDCQASIHEDVSCLIKELCTRFSIDKSTAVEWILYDVERRL
jgi:DNA-directed RNA polymerase subunit RPC12/RpoP